MIAYFQNLRYRLNILLSSSFGKTVLSGYTLFLFTNFAALLLTPYILKYVSKADYGIYLLCIDIISWMALFQFGTSQILSSTAGRLIGQGNYKELNIAYNSTFFFQVLISILIIPLYYVVVSFSTIGESSSEITFVIVVFGFSAGLQIYTQIFSALLIASKKIYLDNLIQLTLNILGYTLILIFVPLYGLVALASINLVVIILIIVRSSLRVKSLFPQLKITRQAFNRASLLNFLKQGIYFSVAAITSIFLSKFDGFFIGDKFGLETVASFYITIKLFTLVEKLTQTFFNNFRPYISQNFGKGDIKFIALFYSIVTPLILGIALVLSGVVLLINEQFIFLWVGKGFFIGSTFCIAYAFYIIINLATLPSRIILSSTLVKLKMHSLFRVIEGLVRISFVFVFLGHFGIFVLPISSFICAFIFGYVALFFLVYMFFKENSLPPNLSAHLPLLLFLMGYGVLSFMSNNVYVYSVFILISGVSILGYLLVSKRKEVALLLKR